MLLPGVAFAGALQIYLWAPVYRENWSAFAPDFQELEENREYIEREDEFDVNEREEDRLALTAAAASNAEGIATLDLLLPRPQRQHSLIFSTCPAAQHFQSSEDCCILSSILVYDVNLCRLQAPSCTSLCP